AGAQWNILCDQSLTFNTQCGPGDDFFQNAGVIQKSGATGTTTFQVYLYNSGNVDVQTGTLSLNTGYSLTGGALNVGINDQTNFGQIVFTGNAALDGSFHANLNNGFVPTNNSSFQVLMFGSSSGAFTNVTAAAPPIWQTNFTATALTLTTVSTITWQAPADIIYGTSLGVAQLDAMAGVTGNYVYHPTAGTVLQSGSGQVLSVLFTPDNPNYLQATLQRPLNVLKAALMITAHNTNKIYGQTGTFDGTEFAAAGLVNGDTATNVTLASAGAPPTATVAGSSYSIIPSATFGTGLSNYNVTYVNGALTVNPAPLTITAGNRIKTYGQMVNFAGTEFTSSGLLNSDSASSVTLTSSGAAATAMAAGSPYSIAPSAAAGIGLGNYNISYNNGTLTVNRAPLTITANNRAKAYGQAVAFAGTEFTPSGLVNSDTASSVTLVSSGVAATATVAGSPYSIAPSAVVGTGLNNYNISYANGTLTVNPATLTITATNRSKIYGQTTTFAGTEFTSIGLVNGDTATSATFTSSGSAGTATVAGSPYNIVPSAVIGTGLNNYNIAYANGKLTVNPATLTITATNRSKTYGQTMTFVGTEFISSGLLNGDNASGVTLTSSGAAATATVAGSPYGIAPSAAVGTGLGNYNINYNNGILTINPAALTITANNRAKTYGQAVTFAGTEFTPSGLLNSDSASSVTLTSSGAVTNATVAGSPYNIAPSAVVGSGLGNYTISYANGTLSVNRAPLTITANNTNKIFGQTITFAGTEFTTTGLQNSEAVGSVTLASAGTTATAPANTYSIVPSAPTGGTFTQNNYIYAFVDGTLTVSALPALSLTRSGTNIIVTYPTVTGEMYQLQSSTNIQPANWISVGSLINGNNGFISETNVINSSAMFYRLQIQN
ncbi:MAG TPA: MBG domain-containing protein, partial [Verrucomicrobiae bacterium]|nr:MBG domain-containing protein [Verrucomicrobiae bacterium]